MKRARPQSDNVRLATPPKGRSTNTNSVDVLAVGVRHSGVSRVRIARLGRAMLHAMGLDESELSILLTDDNEIQRLNRHYRNIDRPTDVLSFSQCEGLFQDCPTALLGDVVISVPTARRQALEQGLDVATEVTRLLAHGLLHLVGWDHVTPAEDRRMRRETERLCASVALGAKGARVTHVNRESGRRGNNGQSCSRPMKKGVT